MRSNTVLPILATVIACAGGRNSELAVEGSVPEESSYEFVATIPFSDAAARVTRTYQLSGVFVRLRDSLFVQPNANCQPLSPQTPGGRGPTGMPTGAGFVRLYCSGTWLTFNRSNPSSARWYTMLSFPRERELCEEYGTRNGRQGCVRKSRETYYETVTRSGTIQVKVLSQR